MNAVLHNTTSVSPENVLRMLDTQIQQCRFHHVGFGDQWAADERQLMAAKHGLSHPEAAAAEYRERVQAKARQIRIEAFDALVDNLGRLLHTKDINMVLPVLRKAGVRYADGDVWVRDPEGVVKGGINPQVFDPHIRVFNRMKAALTKAGS